MHEKFPEDIISAPVSVDFISKAITCDKKLKDKVVFVVVYGNMNFGVAHVYRKSSRAKYKLSLEKYCLKSGAWKREIKDNRKYELEDLPKLIEDSFKYKISEVDLRSNCALTEAQIYILEKLINILQKEQA